MALLQWKDSYDLGIPSVDHEHRELIGMINAVYDHLAGESDADAIESCLEDIYAGIAAHFALEERHMREAAYAEYQAHKDEHEDLLDQLVEMVDEFIYNPKSGPAGLEKNLADWFEKHFATFDARLHQSLGDHHG
jgi:hemerythrin-like metal-binding protein